MIYLISFTEGKMKKAIKAIAVILAAVGLAALSGCGEKYGKYADYVLTVPPGLSGMWQTSGRSDTGYEERINLDTYYIQNWSIWLDIWIIIKTIWVVLIGKGAY
jgi:lipopolysaccharide/colanic/teichoic acid biosynthesis glycosyltransferase